MEKVEYDPDKGYIEVTPVQDQIDALQRQIDILARVTEMVATCLYSWEGTGIPARQEFNEKMKIMIKELKEKYDSLKVEIPPHQHRIIELGDEKSGG